MTTNIQTPATRGTPAKQTKMKPGFVFTILLSLQDVLPLHRAMPVSLPNLLAKSSPQFLVKSLLELLKLWCRASKLGHLLHSPW